MSEQDSVRVVHEVVAAWNAHDPDRYLRCLHDEHMLEMHGHPRPVRGLEAARSWMQKWLHAYPDLQFETQHMVSSGDVVLHSWRVSGTPGVEQASEGAGCRLQT
jgi:hypothetical protein